MKQKDPYLQIMAACPETGEAVATHAWMTPRQISRFKGQLVFFCPACRHTHLLGGPELRRATDAAACEPAKPAPARALGRRVLRLADARLRLVRHVARRRSPAHPAGVARERA